MTAAISTNRLEDLIQYRLPGYQALAPGIHKHPEVSSCGFYSSAALIKQLGKEGSWIEREVAGHRTAFDARYISNKPGPTIAFLAESDILPGIGHACGHNLFGTYSVLAVSIVEQFIDETGGEIRVYGAPGEEGDEDRSAESNFIRESFFENVNVALCVHPAFRYGKATESLANDPVDVKSCDVTSHAAAVPEKGVSALEALTQVFNGIDALRLQLSKDANTHGTITDRGVAASIVPDRAAGRFYLRAGNRQTLDKVYGKVENIVRGAATSTGTTFEFRLFQNIVDDVIVTPSFDDLFFQHAKEAGVPDEEIEAEQGTGLGSSDVGSVSQVIPAVQPTIAISETYIAGHTEEFKATAKSDKGLTSIAIAAELLANVALDLLKEPKLLERIKQEHQEIVTRKKQEGATF